MTVDKKQSAIQLLVERESEVLSELAKLSDEHHSKTRPLVAELKNLRTAMRGLGRMAIIQDSVTPQSLGSGGIGFTTEQLVLLAAEKLTAVGLLSTKELRDHINAEAALQGRPRRGLHFQVNRALKDDRFEQVGDSWRLRTKAIGAGGNLTEAQL